jgi:hypothetical protein
MSDERIPSPYMVPCVGGEVTMNGEVYRVTQVQVADERITDEHGSGRHRLRVQFHAQWDEPDYMEPPKEELY